MSRVLDEISSLVRGQFPALYEDERSLLVDFVVAYYEWLEGRGDYWCPSNLSRQGVSVSVRAGSREVVGRSTRFLESFAPGDKIALSKDAITPGDYETYVVSEVVSDTKILLEPEPLPDWSLLETGFGVVRERNNPLFLSRRFLTHRDIDETLDEFVIHFKQKYLRNLRFDTLVNTRRLVKNSLDLYRSKGTPRSVDLLFKMTFGRPAEVYHPSRDLMRTSDGVWFVPRYLEVVPSDSSFRLVEKQIKGLSSGAKAFVDSVIRRTTTTGKILDVLYVSAIQGEFRTGERVNTFDDELSVRESPLVTGSLTSLRIGVAGSGVGFKRGDLVDIESEFGESARGRVLETRDNFGTVEFSLEDGGYGYTTNAEVLISEKVLRLKNVTPSAEGPYFVELERLVQRSASVTYENASNAISAGDEIFSYFANGDVRGQGLVLSVTQVSANSGEMDVSVTSGDLSVGPLFTLGNAASLDIASPGGYVDTTATATLIGRHTNAVLTVSDVTGTFQDGEEVFQVDAFSTKVANGVVKIASPSTPLTVVVDGHLGNGFTSGLALKGADSGAEGNVQSVDIVVGVVGVSNNAFSTLSKNRVVGEASGFVGELDFVFEGEGASFQVSNTLLYEEEVAISTDRLRDFESVPATLEVLSGNVAVTLGSSSVVGDGTSFTTEIQTSLTGNLSVTQALSSVVGDGTSFTTELSNGSIIELDLGSESVVCRVLEVSNDTHLVVNTSFNRTNTAVTSSEVVNYVRVSANSSVAQARRVVSVSNDTHLVVDSAFGFTNPAAKLERSWGFEGMLEANLSFGVIDDVLSTSSFTVGKISSIFAELPGEQYESSPIVRINESVTRELALPERVVLSITGLDFSLRVGEVVTQGSSDARGLVVSANDSQVTLQNLRIDAGKSFVETTNADSKITGITSGATANVTSVTRVSSSNVHGYNAVITTSLGQANGAVAAVQILNSGFGFVDGERATGRLTRDPERTFTGFVENRTHGTGEGYYFDTGSPLSSNKKLQDGWYWQDYSYEIRSSVSIDRYREMVREIVHVAGTKMFGAFVLDSESDLDLKTETVVADRLYDGWFPIGDYMEDRHSHRGVRLFPYGDWDENSPPREYDCQDDPDVRRIEFPVNEDLESTRYVYMGQRLFPIDDLEASDHFWFDAGRSVDLESASTGPLDLQDRSGVNLVYDCEEAAESLDLDEDLEHLSQTGINTTSIDLDAADGVNLIYDCALYDESIDLQNTLIRS